MDDHYRSPHGLHNFSNILDLFRNFVSKQEDTEIKETPFKKPLFEEERLFFNDAFDEYFEGKIEGLESVSDSLKKRSFE